MSKIPSFLKVENGKVIFNKDNAELVFFIQDSLFGEDESSVNRIDGDRAEIFGMFSYTIYDKNGKSLTGLKSFNFPTMIATKPYEIELKKDLQLTRFAPREDYRLLKFRKGDIVITTTSVIQSCVNIETFFRMFNAGKLPPTISYDKIHEYFLDNAKINDLDFGMTTQILGLIVSESYRSVDDFRIPFRLSGKENMTAYTRVGIKEIPKLVSPFTAVTSENFDEAITNAILNKNHKETPLEKLFTL